MDQSILDTDLYKFFIKHLRNLASYDDEIYYETLRKCAEEYKEV